FRSRTEQHLAVVAAIVGGRFGADGIEALLDGAGGFVGGEDAAARRDHRLGDPGELSEVHGRLLQISLQMSLAKCPCGYSWPDVSNDAPAYFILNTSTPGNALPSIHSRKAPPA